MTSGTKYCGVCGDKKKPRSNGISWDCPTCTKEVLKRVKAKFGGAAKYRNREKSIYPEKYAARKKVETALKWGKIEKRLCERCGSAVVHAHHEDYSKPLDVMWLCPLHHKQRHAELRALGKDVA